MTDSVCINKFILNLIRDGVVVNLYYDRNDNLVYDLNTGMKSECYAVDEGNGVLHLYGRYGWNETWDEPFDDNGQSYRHFVEYIVSHCKHGTDYHNACWSNVIEKFGL